MFCFDLSSPSPHNPFPLYRRLSSCHTIHVMIMILFIFPFIEAVGFLRRTGVFTAITSWKDFNLLSLHNCSSTVARLTLSSSFFIQHHCQDVLLTLLLSFYYCCYRKDDC